MLKIFNKREQGLSLVVFALGLAALMGFAALAIDLGISNNIQNELQKAANSAALVGAATMQPDENGNIDTAKAQQFALFSFNQATAAIPQLGNIVLVHPISGATGSNDPSMIQTIQSSRAVRVQARAQVPTIFMAVIGIKSLQINAQAAAVNYPSYPTRNLPAGFPHGGLIDSDIRDPFGGVNGNVYKCSGGSPVDASFILGPPDNVPVALGPGGSVTVRMPVPIVNGPGWDLYIRELGDAEGYYVYVGIEDPPKSGNIVWNNISCTGQPSDSAVAVSGAQYGAVADENGQFKFYGSGLFNLGFSCSGGGSGGPFYSGNINNATYVKIVDDNVEDGFISQDITKPTYLLGEHSSTSPGADIDAIGGLHHSKLIDFNAKDTDGDGAVDPVEFLYGTNPNNPDTDGDGLSDGQELGCFGGFCTNPRVADTDGDGINDGAEITGGTNPLIAETKG
jgi:hypothetical protein